MLQPLVEPVPCTCDSGGSIDPTGTAVLRRKFRRQVASRVERFRAQVCSAILNKDVLGLDGKSYMSVHPAAVCCAAFAYCLDSASQSFAGGWGSIFIQKAWDSGIAAIGVEVPEHLNRVEQYHLLFQQEVAGIVAALNQQLNRAINEIILSKVTTVSACHTVREVIKKISPRFDALVNTMVVKVHNLARIEALRVSGVEFFRVKAERIPATVVSDARKKLRVPRRTKYVEVITAGDDKVCPRCEMLEGEIFTYGEARLLLPLHINCRCAFVGHYLRALDAFEESAHPRAGIGQHTGGQFTSKGGKPSAGPPVPTRAFGSKNARLQQALAAHHQQEEAVNHYGMKLVRLKKADRKAFNGEQIETKVKLSKLETDAVGESIALSYLRSIGFIHARTANTEGNNFPIDIFADHRAIELKSGQVSNTKAAQQFRVTIGQPGKAETALLKTMSPEEKYKHNAAKLNAAIKRKVDIAKNYGMRPVTMTVLFNPDTKHADVYVLEGYHKRLGWNSKELISGYVGSFYYK